MKEFQEEVRTCISDEIPHYLHLEKLYLFGSALDLDLIEVSKLKQVLMQAKWLNRVRLICCSPYAVGRREVLTSLVTMCR